jgi:hypothetical protein
MSDVIDLSAPTGWWEVAVWHHEGGRYIVSTDRGLGRLDMWESGNRDKAFGVAEYLDLQGRITYDGDRRINNEGEPFTGSIVHWDCGCTQADIDASKGGTS